MNLESPIPLLDLDAHHQPLRSELLEALVRVLDSQRFILGPEVDAFEAELAAYSDCKYGVGVSSGTDALLAALMAVGIKAGDEVITTPYSFFATAGSVARLGAKPVFIDIDPLTYNMDPDKLESAITSRTRAIIPVHLYGQLADMDPIMEIARRHKLNVIEDAAQAIGSLYKGQKAGSIGHLGCFSFYPSKNLGGLGDGGMVTTNDLDLMEKVKLLRGHGAQPKYYHHLIGGNFRLDALQAAVLRVKLKHLDTWTKARQRNAAIYRELFIQSELSSKVKLPYPSPHCMHIYNQFVIRVSQRDELISHLKSSNIGHEIYYPLPLHLQPCFSYLGYKPGDFPESERASQETLALPIYPELTRSMIDRVVQNIKNFYLHSP